MKKLLFLFFCCFHLFIVKIYAQIPQYFIGTGTGGNSIPFGGGSWADQRCQFLYTPGEFGTAPTGLITKVYFRSSGSAASTYTNLRIDIGNSSILSLPGSTWVTGLTTAFMATTYSVTPTVGGWVGYQLQTPVFFDPSQSLVVDTRQTATSGGYAIYTASATGTRRQYSASASGSPTGSSATRYDFGFDIITCQGPTNVLANNITVQGATMNWSTVSGSLGYEYVLDQNPGNPPGAGTFTAVNTKAFTGLNLNTTYYFHVRNICSNGYSPWVNVPFTTLNAYCLPPTNILYTGINKTSVDLLWSKMPTSDWYQYKVDLTPNPPLTSANTISTPGIQASVTGLQPGTKYYVFMRSICLNGDDSSYWKRDSFITKYYCDAPEVTITNGGTNTPTASWLPVPDAVAYEYRVTNSTATPSFGTETLNTLVDLTLDPDGIDKYLHVRSKCNSQFTFSNWVTNALRTGTTSITNVNATSLLDVYPNPATDIVTIELKELKADASIAIMDAAGRVVRSVALKEKKTVVSLKDIAPGAYMLRFSDVGSKELIKFNKL